VFGGKGGELPAQGMRAGCCEEAAASHKKIQEITVAALLIQL